MNVLTDNPTNFGRYEVKSILDQDPIVPVYRAYDPDFDGEVVIKIFRKKYFSGHVSFREFEERLASIAFLNHSIIVPIYHIGELDQEIYVVMRFMDGGTLADRLQNGPIPQEDATRLIYELAPLLDLLHARGIVHGALEPKHIYFDGEGNPYLGGFEMWLFREILLAENAAIIFANPAYQSPEQILGTSEIDGRCDVYALGAILYHMLTGKIPVYGDTPLEIAAWAVSAPIPSLDEDSRSMPVDFQRVIDFSMKKNPKGRFPTLNEMAVTTATAAEGHPITWAGYEVDGTPIPASANQPKKRGYGCLLACTLAFLTTAVVFAAFFMGWLNPIIPPIRQIAGMENRQPTPTVMVAMAVPADTQIPPTDIPVPTEVMQMATASVEATATPAALFTVEIANEAGLKGFVPGEEITFNFSKPVGPMIGYKVLFITPPLDGEFTWESKKQTLVFTPDPDSLQLGGVYFISLNSDLRSSDGDAVSSKFQWQLQVSRTAPTEAAVIETSPPLVLGGADKLAFLNEKDIWVSNLDGSDFIRLTTNGAARSDLKFTPDGMWLTYFEGGTLWRMDINNGSKISISGNYSEFQISPDMKKVFLGADVQFPNSTRRWQNIYTTFGWNSVGGIHLTSSSSCLFYAGKQVQFSQDGTKISAVGDSNLDGRPVEFIQFYDLEGCSIASKPFDSLPGRRFTMRGYSGLSEAPLIKEYSWNGNQLVALHGDIINGLGDLIIYNLDTGKAEVVNPIDGQCCYRDVRWSPDGQYLLFAFQDIRYGIDTKLYYVPAGTLGIGMKYEPLDLPFFFFAQPGEWISPALRPVQE